MTDEYKWEFRIIKSNESYDSIDEKLSIQECLLDEHGVLVSHTIDYIVGGNDVNEMESVLSEMKQAFQKPILSEIRGIDYTEN
tara:strand:- start:851 stop:1099 length:249 start_codon:yes stop_codon:yes gene_type:complete